MRSKIRSVNWRAVVMSLASLATLLLAAGARWKPK
jgi:hypothetical protein